MANVRPRQKQMSWLKILQITVSDEDICILHGKTSGAMYFLCCYYIRYTNERLDWGGMLCIFYNILLMYIYLTTGSHLWIHFYLHSPNFTLFSFCPQSISIVFCFVFFHLITEFELDLYHISLMRSQVLHFCSFLVLLASILARSRVYIIKPKEDHQLPLFTFIPAF